MSWVGTTLMFMEYGFFRTSTEKADLGIEGLLVSLEQHIAPEVEKCGPLELDRRFDDVLVELIWLDLLDAELEKVSCQEVESKLREHERYLTQPLSVLRALKEDLCKNEGVPLASVTYLKLARRRIKRLAGWGTEDSRRPPSSDEARPFARAMLAPYMNPDLWEQDWDRQDWDRTWADSWLQERDPMLLSELIENSREGRVAWNALLRVSEKLVALDEEPPRALFKWTVEASTGIRKRPEERSAPRHRRRKFGYIRRNNDIRHTVTLLMTVGMTKEEACKAVHKAYPGLIATITVQRICAKPSDTVHELKAHAMSFVEPSLFGHQDGSSSDTDSSQSQ